MNATLSRAPYGARGLKFATRRRIPQPGRRAPYGARGLKFSLPYTMPIVPLVAPRMGRVD